MLHRLLAFMFEHDYAFDPKTTGYDRSLGVVGVMVCKQCGHRTRPFPVTDRALFNVHRWRKGCPGNMARSA